MMIVLLILTLFCALQAIQSSHLLNAALWLAMVSALVATMFYAIGAWQIAAIELSVGTGLVTVLMVFAITMVGNEREARAQQRLPLLLVIVSVLLLITVTVPFLPATVDGEQQPLTAMLWQERGLDLLLQIALIFCGVLGVIGLLSEAKDAEHIVQGSAGTQDTRPLPEPDLDVAEDVAQKETKEAA